MYSRCVAIVVMLR